VHWRVIQGDKFEMTVQNKTSERSMKEKAANQEFKSTRVSRPSSIKPNQSKADFAKNYFLQNKPNFQNQQIALTLFPIAGC
jgi:hypothetical protein